MPSKSAETNSAQRQRETNLQIELHMYHNCTTLHHTCRYDNFVNKITKMVKLNIGSKYAIFWYITSELMCIVF